MKLKWLINRFTETDSIEVPITFTTTFDATGAEQLRNDLSQIETSFKKTMSSSVGRVSLFGKDYFGTKPAEKYQSTISNLQSQIKDMSFEQVLDYKAPTVGELFSKNTPSILEMDNAYSTVLDKFKETIPVLESVDEKMKDTFKVDYVSELKEQTKEAYNSYKILNTEVGNTESKATQAGNALKKLSTIMRGSLLIQIQALINVLKRAFSFLTESFTAAGDYVESINLYTMSVGNYSEAGQKWATKISEALYLDTSEIYQYTGQFFNLTRGLGATAKAADLMSRNLTQLTYDMSSYLNIDVETANNKLMSAMSGQTKAVTSVGIAVQSASLQELAYSLGIKKSVQEMTQAEKTYLRYIQIMRSTTQMQGDLGRTIITPTNAMRLLRTQMNLLSRAIGQVFTPIIMEVIPVIIAFTQVLTELAQRLAALFGYKLEDYLAPADSVKSLSDGFGDLSDNAKDAAKNINRTLAPFDKLNVVASKSKKKGSGLDNSVLKELEQYLTGYDMLEYYTGSMGKKIDGIKKKLEDVLPVIGLIGSAFATWKISSSVVDVVSKLLGKKGTLQQKIGLTLVVTSVALSYLGSLAIKEGNFWEGIAKQLGASFGTGLGVFLMTKNIKLGLVATALQFTINAIFDADNFWAAALNILGGSLVVAGSVLKYTKDMQLTIAVTVGYTIVSTLATLIFGDDDEPTLIDKLKDSSKAAQDFNTDLTNMYDTINKNKDANLKLIDSHKDLYDELIDLVDENGKVKDGYEDRVSYILNELQSAYGIEYKLTNGQIEGYGKLKKSIEDVIAKKKLEILLEANKEAYIEAIKHEKEAIEGLNSSTEKLVTAKNGLKTAEENLSKKQKELNIYQQQYGKDLIGAPRKVKALKEEVDKLTMIYNGQKTAVEVLEKEQAAWKDSVEKNTKAIAEYNEGLELSYKGTTEEIEGYMDDLTAKTDGSLSDQLKYTKTKRDEMVKYYEKTGKDIENNQVKTYNRQYQTLIKKLKEQTIGVEKLTPELKEAWEELAKQDKSAFLSALDDLPNETKDQLKPITNTLKTGLLSDFTNVGAIFGKALGTSISDNTTIDSSKISKGLGSALSNVELPSALKNAPAYIKQAITTALQSAGISFKADGGFLKTGEMFVAREAGPELVGKIGNRTAVANNEQITTAMTNAMLTALNGANNNKQPVNNTIYIGNKKVYEGMGDYVDSENDRYGTNYIRV